MNKAKYKGRDMPGLSHIHRQPCLNVLAVLVADDATAQIVVDVFRGVPALAEVEHVEAGDRGCAGLHGALLLVISY